MKLYDLALADTDVRPSPWCWLAKFALLHKGVDFDAEPVHFADKTKYPDPEHEDLRELVRTAVFPQKVAFPDIDFEIDAGDAPSIVDCDGRLIVQALSNLLKNAGESITARAAEPGFGYPGRILVSIVNGADDASIHIVDNGLGLPSKERHRLAEPYMTTREKGTGLGLAIVKKVAEEHARDRFARRRPRYPVRYGGLYFRPADAACRRFPCDPRRSA